MLIVAVIERGVVLYGMRRALCCIAALCCVVFMMGMSAGFTVSVDYETFADVEIRLYHVGDAQGGWMDGYAEYGLKIDDIGTASTLSSYVSRDDKLAAHTGVTDKSGHVSFDNVSSGIYLLDGDRVETNDGIYQVVPSLIQVTDFVQVDVKHELLQKVETVSKTVRKVWAKSNNTPEIQADLLKNGVLFDSQVLNDSCNWTYTWDDLDGTASWSIVEHEVPEDYLLTVVTDGDVTFLTNTGVFVPSEPDEPKVEPPKTNPETGVKSNTVFLIVLFSVLGVLALVSFIVVKMKTKRGF